MTDIPDSEVGAFADLERTSVVQQTQRASGLPRGAGEAFTGCEFEKPRGQHHCRSERTNRRGARIAVRRNGYWNTFVAERGDWRQPGFGQRQECARQQHGHR